MKAAELREMGTEQLELTLAETSEKLFRLRMQSQTERLDAPSELRHHRRLVARIKTIRELLLPKVFLVTPNLHEAETLAGMEASDLASMERAARRIAERGPESVLITGGHLQGDAVDLLLFEDRIQCFRGPRLDSSRS